jgi:hypothetical protein
MYIYQVGYWTMEESPSYYLFHVNKYTQEQFDDIVSDAFVKSYKDKWPICELKDISDEHGESTYETDYVDDILDDAMNYLYKEGFIEIKTDITFEPFGWASISDESSWKGSYRENDKLNMIREKLNIHKRDSKLGDILK